MESLPPWPMVQSLLLTVVLPGFGIGAGGLALTCAATRSETGRVIGGALALIGGLALGNFARGLLPWWSQEGGWPSLFTATVFAVIGGVLAALILLRFGSTAGAPGIAPYESKTIPEPSNALRSRFGLALRLFTVAICAWWLAPADSSWIRAGWLLLLFTSSALHWEAFCRVGVPILGERTLLAISIPWGMFAATVLIYAASARFFDMTVLMTATLAGLGFVTALRKIDTAALFAGPAIFLPALMLAGAENTFSEVPVASFILVAVAPYALWLLRLPPLLGWSKRARTIAVIVAVLAPCAIAVALALRAESLDFSG